MWVKIQLILDDGRVLVEHVQNAFQPGGWEADLGLSPLEGGRKLDGFTYIPAPPPRGPEDVAEFRRLWLEHFGA